LAEEKTVFGIGMPELMVILVIALLVVGPKRLPDLAKTIGKGMAEFRRATEGATETLKESLRVDEIKQDVENMKESFLSDREQHSAAESPSPSAPPAAEGNKQDLEPHVAAANPDKRDK
jgi:Tat protein translocase TatB subunit